MTIFNPMIAIAVKAALAKATDEQLRLVEERLEALAEHTLYLSDSESIINECIDFGAQMAVYKRYELVRVDCGDFNEESMIFGFAGDPEQVLAKVLATINQ